MKKITLLIVLSLLFSLNAKSQQITTSSGSNFTTLPWENPMGSISGYNNLDPQNMVACDGVLANYNNLTPDNLGGVTSQDFEAANNAFDSFAADDFIAPAGGNSTICRVSIIGISTGAGLPADPATLIVMRIYNDAGGVPGAQIFTESFPGSLDGNNDGDFILDPTGVPELTAGTKYWLNIQAQMSFGTSGQWFWDTSSDGSDSPYAFQNPGGGFGTGCAVWTPHATCGLSGAADLLMDISFNAVAAGPISVCAAGNPRPIPASGTGGAGCVSPTLSPATVTATGNIGAASGDYILDSIEIQLTHTWANDLDIYLVSPSGAVTVELSTDNGGNTGLDSPATLVFTDSSVNAVTGWAGGAPAADYLAEGGLLNTLLAGQSINGAWTLRICDDAGGDVGTLLSYCINLSEITTVGDAPIIVCPADIVANNSPGTCGAAVNFAGVALDTEDGNISGDIIATPASGSVFPVGDTTVTLSVTDSDGNTSTCEFTVTVVDNETPIAVCQDLTVDLDASGVATITAADVDNGSTDNCGIATYELGIASAPTTGSLSTLYSGGNGGSNGGAVYFDLTVGPNDIDVTSIDINTGEAGTVTMNVFTIVGTSVGNETNAGAWGAADALATGTAAGAGNPSNLILDNPITFNANTTYGIALDITSAHGFDYTNGTGCPGNQCFSNADLSLALGKASNVPFTTPIFSPRVFNGGLIYEVAAGIVPFNGTFDCSNVGENIITLTVTDAAGNSSSCTSTVTIQDVTAPEVFCVGGFGIFSESEDFEAGLPADWSTVVNTGNCDWINSGNMPTGDDFPTLAMLFDDDDCGSGAPASNVSLLSAVYDLTGASNVTVGYDVAFQESGTQTFTVEVFDGAAWQQIAFYDADLDPDIQTESIDVSAFVNATFQVRWTFDDNNGEWGWAAGVDNFLLNYEAASGGGLDVFLDANGMASIDPNDLVTGVNEACGYTITAGGGGGGTAENLTTTFAGGNGNFGNMFDMNAIADVTVDSFDINADTGATFDVEVYAKTGTWVGFEADPSAWTLIGTALGVVSNGDGVATPLNLTLNYVMAAGETHAFYVTPTDFSTGGLNYTNGTGTGNVFASDANIEFLEGAARGYPFAGTTFQPRVFNGNILYTTGGGGSGLDFTCADLGENLIEVTVTDDSGNVSTCTAVVNVIDNIAPILVCQDATIELGPDGTATVDPMALLASLPTTYEVMVIGSDNQSGTEGFTDFTVSVTEAANVTFDWDYTSNDPDPGFDGFGYLLNGTYTQLTDPLLGNQSGSEAITVNPGDVFGFRSQTDDNVFGNTETVISNFMPGFSGQFDPANWNLTLSNSDGDAFFVEIPGGPLSFDACGITILAVDVPTVTCADIGTPITVTVFASDASGNIAACTSIITVVDLLAPVLTCPADQTVDPGVGNLFYILPDYIATGEATAIDNCTDPVTITTQDPAPGTALSDGVYTITMTATDEYGNTSTCDFELTVESILGVNQNSLDAGVALYPNPASNVVNLVNKTNISLEKMMIYDINGKLVNQIDLRSMQGEKAVDVSSLAAGVYVVQIIGDNASTVKRLIKE